MAKNRKQRKTLSEKVGIARASHFVRECAGNSLSCIDSSISDLVLEVDFSEDASWLVEDLTYTEIPGGLMGFTEYALQRGFLLGFVLATRIAKASAVAK